MPRKSASSGNTNNNDDDKSSSSHYNTRAKRLRKTTTDTNDNNQNGMEQSSSFVKNDEDTTTSKIGISSQADVITSSSTTTSNSKRKKQNNAPMTAMMTKMETTEKLQTVVSSSIKDNNDNKNNNHTSFFFILSPSKTLDVIKMGSESSTSTSIMKIHTPSSWTVPNCDWERTNTVIRTMKQHCQNGSISSLGKILGISTNLATTAVDYWTTMQELTPDTTAMPSSSSVLPPSHPENQYHIKPAIYSFKGAAYHGLDIDTMDTTQVEYLQRHLRIIDPLYGWLRPMDIMQPYRLEMATRNLFGKPTNDQQPQLPNKLHEFWKPAIHQSIANEQQEKEEDDTTNNNIITIINVASEEYSAAVGDTYRPQIKIVFQNEGRVIAIHAKRARGLFVRYCAQKEIHHLSDMKGFNLEGYKYKERESDETTFVFDRPKNWNKK